VDLTLNITAWYSDVTISNMTIADAELDRVNLTNCVISSSIVRNSTGTMSVFTSSEIFDTTLGTA